MAWIIEYFEELDSRQPAEVYEDSLIRVHAKLGGKLQRIAAALEEHGPHLGGGLIEPCHGYRGLWEMRAIYNQWLAREFFGFDGGRVVLLHGYVKRAGQPAVARELEQAHAYWNEYQHTRRISPESEEEHE